MNIKFTRLFHTKLSLHLHCDSNMSDTHDCETHKIHPDGTEEWYNSSGQRHRDGDLPAMITSGGVQVWYKNGLVCRDNDKPSVVHPDGTQIWYEDGDIHRDSKKGPAIISSDGTMSWFFEGDLHRNDGPAIVRLDGFHQWFAHGRPLFLHEIDEIIERNSRGLSLEEISEEKKAARKTFRRSLG